MLFSIEISKNITLKIVVQKLNETTAKRHILGGCDSFLFSCNMRTHTWPTLETNLSKRYILIRGRF